jgi:hypothetical protein
MACEANVIKGRELVLLVRTDDELTFEVIGGIQERGFTIDNPTEETTSSSTVGDYSENEWTGYSALTMDVSGVADKRKGTLDPATGFNIIDFNRLLQLATSGNRCGYFKIVSTDPSWNFFAEGFMNVSNVNMSGSTPGLLGNTATLSNKSDMTVMVGA